MTVTRSAFGALPIQRLSVAEAAELLQKAREQGINFYDTARGYSDSEEKLGVAFAGSEGVIIASKTPATDYDGAMRDLETSLAKLKRDRIDIYQLHNPSALPATPGTSAAPCTRCGRRNGPGRSAISASPTTPTGWPSRRRNPGCTKPCSSP